jgi:hypothetical protein
MQATLVSHYGEKPDELASHVKRCQDELTTSLSSAFTPHEMAQVHGTIIGLEGCRRKGQVENTNFRERRQEVRYMDPSQLFAFLRSPSIPSFDVQIGGYVESTDYGFLSLGKHPYFRSFSIQGVIAVAMGWPTDGTSVLDDFRRSFNQQNALHKWHKTESDIDDDLFFVLGRVNRESASDATIANAETHMRQFMTNANPITVNVNRSSLRIVCYVDTQLPLSTSHAHAIDDPTFTPDDLLQCYDECNNDSEQ